MSTSNLQIEHDGAVATLWLNRPEVHNAFDEHLIAALTDALCALEGNAATRVIVLAGRGRSFCAGGDLDWMRRMAGFSLEENLRDAGALAAMLSTLANCSKPTIARIHGAALAGGTGLVAACDIAIATPDAAFGTTEVRLGLIPATISPYVIRAIGARAAQRYFLTGERFDAAQALRLGLVHELCEPDQLDACVQSLAQALLAGAPQAQAACKQLVRDVAGHVLDSHLINDTTTRIATARSGMEAREGISAFFAKRTPAWRA